MRSARIRVGSDNACPKRHSASIGVKSCTRRTVHQNLNSCDAEPPTDFGLSDTGRRGDAEVTSKNRVHLDVHVDEDRKTAEAERLVALGAQVVDEHADRGARTIVMQDPEGNESACTDGSSIGLRVPTVSPTSRTQPTADRTRPCCGRRTPTQPSSANSAGRMQARA